MNRKNDLTPIDPVELDLLVDGELDETQRRELLVKLEREPENWRQCALAFLESQAWRQGVSRAAPPPPSTPVPAAASRVSRRFPGAARTMAAMAACFLLALGVGLMLPHLRSDPAGSMNVATNDSGVGSSQMPLPAGDRPAAESSQPWQVVTVPVTSDQGATSIGVPCTERQSIDKRWLDGLPQAFPQDVVDALSRAGHRVTSERRPVTVPLDDGRELVIPVDQVEIRYVGNRDYQ